MPQQTSEQLSQRLFDCGLVESNKLDRLFGELGTREVPLEEFQNLLLRREIVTNWQLERLLAGHVTGYFFASYKILYLVGAGTFARVYRAVNVETGAVRALKVLRNRYGEDVETTERFLLEARTVMTLRHPNIVPIYEVESERGRYYMVMDFIEGQNLRDFVRVHKKLNLRSAVTITQDIAAGLDFAFQRGVTHRDLKLSNVLLSSSGRACLTDFGLALADEGFSSVNSDGAGNPRSIDYAGLERATGVGRDDKRSDLFFLGCMLYHMVTGKPALVETRERIQRLSVQRYREITPVTVHEPDLPHRVVVLINRLIDVNPDQRIQTPGKAVREIESVLKALDSGDTAAYDARLAAREAERHRRSTEKATEGESFTLMVVESSVKIQDAMREGLKKLGYRVLIFSDPRRALQRFEDRGYFDEEGRALADCVLFGCAELEYDALDAFNHFGDNEETRGIPSILVTSDGQDSLVSEAKLAEHRVHMKMPLKFRELRAELRRLLQKSSTESPPTV